MPPFEPTYGRLVTPFTIQIATADLEDRAAAPVTIAESTAGIFPEYRDARSQTIPILSTRALRFVREASQNTDHTTQRERAQLNAKRIALTLSLCFAFTVLVFAVGYVIICRNRRIHGKKPNPSNPSVIEPFVEKDSDAAEESSKSVEKMLRLERRAALEESISHMQDELAALQRQQSLVPSALSQAEDGVTRYQGHNEDPGVAQSRNRGDERGGGLEGHASPGGIDVVNLAQNIARLMERVAHIEAQRQALDQRASFPSTGPPSYASRSPRESVAGSHDEGDRSSMRNPFE
ncbi:hypothetical protein HGRIS_005377 [Hohenbuehelia grisea]|uniref:Uncharacterized protein n=1 Tax=Hohenbuehelia grisea TaxID=104357 RepID=A0ABR3JF43_9AGAR